MYFSFETLYSFGEKENITKCTIRLGRQLKTLRRKTIFYWSNYLYLTISVEVESSAYRLLSEKYLYVCASVCVCARDCEIVSCFVYVRAHQ